jgi:putative FmdB family regulatory protein
MPTYAFACKKCGKEFVLVLRLSERDQKKIKCPKCKSPDVKSVPQTFFATTSKKS